MSSYRASAVPLDEWDYVGLPMGCTAEASTHGTVELEGSRIADVDGRKIAVAPIRLRVAEEVFDLVVGTEVFVRPGEQVRPGAILARWDPNFHPILALSSGRVRYGNVSDRTCPVDVTGRRASVLRASIDGEVTVSLVAGTQVIQHHWLPLGSGLLLDEDTSVRRGDRIAVIPAIRVRPNTAQPLPEPTALLERWVNAWKGEPDQANDAPYGVVKVLAELPVADVLHALPEDLREAVLEVARSEAWTRTLFRMGTRGTGVLHLEIHEEAQHVALERFEAGLLALRAHLNA